MTQDSSSFLPLSPAHLHILVALSAEDLHGYGIMRAVLDDTGGQYKLGPATLYDNLQRLLDQGLVQETSRRTLEDPRRRYYRLTTLGKTVVTAEISRLEAMFRKVKSQLKARNT